MNHKSLGKTQHAKSWLIKENEYASSRHWLSKPKATQMVWNETRHSTCGDVETWANGKINFEWSQSRRVRGFPLHGASDCTAMTFFQKLSYNFFYLQFITQKSTGWHYKQNWIEKLHYHNIPWISVISLLDRFNMVKLRTVASPERSLIWL